MHHQLIQDGRKLRDTSIFLVFLLQARQCSAEIGLRLHIIPLRKVNITQLDLANRLVHATLRALINTQLVIFDSIQRILSVQIDIAQGIIDLIQIVFVLLALRHTLQHLHDLQVVAARKHLALADTSGKLQFIRRIGANHLRKSLIGQAAQVQIRIDLPQEVLHTSPLFAVLLRLDRRLQIGYCLLKLLVLDEVIGIHRSILL